MQVKSFKKRMRKAWKSVDAAYIKEFNISLDIENADMKEEDLTEEQRVVRDYKKAIAKR